MAGKKYAGHNPDWGSEITYYTFSGPLRIKRIPKIEYFNDALKFGAEKSTGKGPVDVIERCYQMNDQGQLVEIRRPKVIGRIIFTGDRYLGTILENGPKLVVYHDLERISHSREIYLYPGNKAVVGGYMDKRMRDRYLKH